MAESDGGRRRLAIFDFDGVIVETDLAKYESWRTEFDRVGLPLSVATWQGFWDYPTGPRGMAGVKHCLQEVGLSSRDVERVARSANLAFEEAREVLPLRRGMGLWIDEAGTTMRLAIVSDSQRSRIERALKRFGLLDAFDSIVSREDVARRKPDPAGYRAGLARSNCLPSDAVAIEDSANGIRAALGAGVGVLAVPTRVSLRQSPFPDNVQAAEPRFVSFQAALRLLNRSREMPSREPQRVLVQLSMEGIAIGDAIGSAIGSSNHLNIRERRKLISALSSGAPPPVWFSGVFSDDTMGALLALASVRGGTVSRDDLQRRLLRENTRGGNRVQIARTSDPESIIFDRGGSTNGSTTRCAVVGWLQDARSNAGDLLHEALKISTITHGGPEALAGSLAYALACSLAVRGESANSVRTHLARLVPAIARLSGTPQTFTGLLCASTSDRPDFGLGVEARESVRFAISLALDGHHWMRGVTRILDEGGERSDLDSVLALYLGLALPLHAGKVGAGLRDRVLPHLLARPEYAELGRVFEDERASPSREPDDVARRQGAYSHR